MNKIARKKLSENTVYLLIKYNEFAFQLKSNDRWRYLRIDFNSKFPEDTYSKLKETKLNIAEDPLFGFSTINSKKAIALLEEKIKNDSSINQACLLEIINILKLKS